MALPGFLRASNMKQTWALLSKKKPKKQKKTTLHKVLVRNVEFIDEFIGETGKEFYATCNTDISLPNSHWPSVL